MPQHDDEWAPPAAVLPPSASADRTLHAPRPTDPTAPGCRLSASSVPGSTSSSHDPTSPESIAPPPELPSPPPPARFGSAAGWAALAAAAAALAYAGALSCGFVIDDVHQIVENDWVTSFRHLPEVFGSGVWDFEGRTSSYYRPLMYVWYMAIHAIAGKAPWAFHLGSVLLHAAATALLTLVAARLLGDGEGAHRSLFLPPPLAAGLLFALHPIHTEPVAWVAGACDLGFALFGLAALWLWMKAQESAHSSSQNLPPASTTVKHERQTRPGAWGRIVAASVCVLASALFKEPGVTIVVVLVAYDVLVRREPIVPRLRALRYAVLSAAPLIYIGLRLHALGTFAPTAGGPSMGASTWAGSIVVLASRYLQFLLLPVNLSFWHAFVPPSSLLSLDVVLAGTTLLVAILAAVITARKSRAAAFALALLVIPLLPAFHLGALNQGIENVLAERYLYLPSAGFVLLAAFAYGAIASGSERAERLALTTVLAVAALYAAGTALRVPVWRDHLTLWSDAAAKAPDSAAARMNHGFALLAAGRTEEGDLALRSAASQQPELIDRELAKAAAYMDRGLTRKAIFAFQAALAMRPDFPQAHFGLGVAYDKVGWMDAAIHEYERTIELAPDHADAHNNVGILEAQRGDMVKALAHFETALRLRPDDADFRANLERARGSR